MYELRKVERELCTFDSKLMHEEIYACMKDVLNIVEYYIYMLWKFMLHM